MPPDEKCEKEKYSFKSGDSNFTLNSKHHLETVHERKFWECPFCQKVFRSKEDVNTHSLTVHQAQAIVNEETTPPAKKRAKRGSFQCPICFIYYYVPPLSSSYFQVHGQ